MGQKHGKEGDRLLQERGGIDCSSTTNIRSPFPASIPLPGSTLSCDSKITGTDPGIQISAVKAYPQAQGNKRQRLEGLSTSLGCSAHSAGMAASAVGCIVCGAASAGLGCKSQDPFLKCDSTENIDSLSIMPHWIVSSTL